MSSITLPPKSPNRKLHWRHVSRRTLLLVVTIAAVGMSYMAVAIERQRNQWTAATNVKKLGGYATLKPTCLSRLLGDNTLANVTELNVNDGGPVWRSRRSPKNVSCPAGARPRSVLDEHQLAATAQSLEHMSELRDLSLAESKISNGDLSHVRGLTMLKRLYLDDTMIQDGGLVHLHGLTQLEQLTLDRTNITDAGVVQLEGLKQLRYLSLVGTKVTDEGVKKLQQTLPTCKIVK